LYFQKQLLLNVIEPQFTATASSIFYLNILQNEEEIGQVIREYIESSKLTREDLYITSKISPFEMKDEATTQAAAEAILTRLGLEYVDLLLIHWPGVAKTDLSSPENAEKRHKSWQILEKSLECGLARAIGVSNYEIHHLEELLTHAKVLPTVNQVECHPKWPQNELRQFCFDHNIAIAAYSPFAAGEFFRDPELSSLIEKITFDYCPGKTPAQMLLCWGLQKGCCCVLPKSIVRERISEFSLDAPGMQKILNKGEERWLSVEAEAALDALGATPELRKKYCWDPSGVA
jgi:methylglyoxal/glyoxal reductase